MTYITGDTIKKLREKKELTQKQLAEKLTVTDKAVSNGKPAGDFRTSVFFPSWPGHYRSLYRSF